VIVSSTGLVQLRDRVRGAYSAVAENPNEKHAFPVASHFAEGIGYLSDDFVFVGIFLNDEPLPSSEMFVEECDDSATSVLRRGIVITDSHYLQHLE
jgi:hypothetical protein